MLKCIKTYLPRNELTNEQLASEFEEWTCEKIFSKTGIRSRRIAGREECASDLACAAAEKLLRTTGREQVDFLLFCTQTPDYVLPTTACLLQSRLGLSKSVGALDFNLGCSGYIYGLALAQSLVQAGLARDVLLLNADTYSKLIHPTDKAVKAIFGDAGAATLIGRSSGNKLHSFVFGTDGSGAEQIMVKEGGCRHPAGESIQESAIADTGGLPNPACLSMNGPEVFNFTLGAVPALVDQVRQKAGLTLDEIDYFVFHQANAFMLERLRQKIGIPREKFVLSLEHTGNTVSATIPLALEGLLGSGALRAPARILLAGFGVGLSWGGCMLEWKE